MSSEHRNRKHTLKRLVQTSTSTFNILTSHFRQTTNEIRILTSSQYRMSTITTSASNRPFDVLIYGATGYTGSLVAARLLASTSASSSSISERQRQRHKPPLRIAVAGRDKNRLMDIAGRLDLPRSSAFVSSVPASWISNETSNPNNVAERIRLIMKKASQPFLANDTKAIATQASVTALEKIVIEELSDLVELFSKTRLVRCP